MELRPDQLTGMMMASRQEAPDPKANLWQFCQRFCKRVIAKTDIQYNSAKVHPNGTQATVKLLCLQGQEFAGEICANSKDAEKSAATQALQFYGMETQPLPQAPPPMGGGMGGMGGMSPQLLAMSGMPGQGRPGQVPPQMGNPGQGMFNPASFHMMGGAGGAPMGVSPAFGGAPQNFGMPQGMGGMDAPSHHQPAPNRPRPDNRGDDHFGGGGRGGGKGGAKGGGKRDGGGKGGGKGKGGQDGMRPSGGKGGGGGGMPGGGGGKGGGDRQAPGGKGGGRGGGGKPAGGPGPAPQPKPEKKADGEEGDVDTSKSTLNVVCMKLLKRPMQKGEIAYDTQQTPGGFQSILRLPCLPEPWSTRQWTGKVSMNRKTAEQDAAETALVDIKAAEEFAALLASGDGAAKPKKKSAGEKKEGEEGKGKGKGKGKKGKMAAFFEFAWGGKGMKGGPDLPREVVSEAMVTGEVAEWKGNFGWIKPQDGAIDHAGLQGRGGKVYVHKQDIGGLDSLEQGATVKFKVYSDTSGLGASELVLG